VRVLNLFIHCLSRLGRLAAAGAVFTVVVGGLRSAAAQTIQFDGTQRPVALGFYEPESVAVDRYGNLFVADADTFLISEIQAVNGAIPPNPIVRVLYRDTWNPEAITVDKSGNVFFADYNDMSPPNGQTIKETLAVNGSIPASPTVSLLSNYLFAVKSTGTWDSTLLSVSIENRIVFPATVPL
jgi:hypothetical protein